MIKLDPEEEADDDDAALKTPQKPQIPIPNTSQATTGDVTMNHMNNVQVNMARVNIPTAMDTSQNFVSLRNVSHSI